MNLTEFGRVVRKARIDAKVSLQQMAADLEVTAPFLSAMEMGRKKVSSTWLTKIQNYFESKGLVLPDLPEKVDISNKSVSLEGLNPQQMMMVAGFARTPMSVEQMQKFSDLLREVKEDKLCSDHQ